MVELTFDAVAAHVYQLGWRDCYVLVDDAIREVVASTCASGASISVGLSEERSEFIERGITRREAIAARLGPPHFIWEDQDIWVYVTFSGQERSAEPIALLIQFDQSGVVERVERREKRGTWGDFLRNWVQDKSE
jgi:hypothetical protein